MFWLGFAVGLFTGIGGTIAFFWLLGEAIEYGRTEAKKE